MILLLTLPLTVLMAIDYTMTKEEGLFINTTTESPDSVIPSETPLAGSNNPYLEPVNLPECDPGNPEVQFIRSNADWSTINSSKRIFCVSPGDYTSLKEIELTANGTAEKRRYIVLDNGNSIHPGKLATNEIANFALKFNNASYWTIDRAAAVSNSLRSSFLFKKGSTHNILNRAFTDDIIVSVMLKDTANNNTIQECRFQNMSHNGRLNDNPAISIIDYSLTKWTIKNTKIIGNEIVNTNDGIQSVTHQMDEAWQIANTEGTIIDSNDIYIDSSIYTDGDGNYDPNGSRAYAENGIDLKGGSLNSTNPIIITNNHIWGYRRSDSTDSRLSDPGYAFVAHYGVGNTKFNNNVIFDSNSGFGVGDKQQAAWAMYDSEVKGNIIKDCETQSGDTNAFPLLITQSNNITVQDNIIINARNAYLRFSSNGKGMMVTKNDGINSPVDITLTSNQEGTYSDNNNDYKAAEDAGYSKDYTFTTDKFTHSPRVIILENTVR